MARWFAAAAEEAAAGSGNWAEPRGEAAAGPMPVCRFKNKFAYARADVADGCSPSPGQPDDSFHA